MAIVNQITLTTKYPTTINVYDQEVAIEVSTVNVERVVSMPGQDVIFAVLRDFPVGQVTLWEGPEAETLMTDGYTMAAALAKVDEVISAEATTLAAAAV